MAEVSVGTLTSFNHDIQEWSLYREKLEQWFMANDVGDIEDNPKTKRHDVLLSRLSEYKVFRVIFGNPD